MHALSLSIGESPTDALTTEAIKTYSVSELVVAIGNLLERGFAPRFLVEASISKAQLKKGHLWMTLSDGKASITAVVWASRLKQIAYIPKEDDGVIVVGKINFWAARASLAVQVLDMRPKRSTVLRQFEQVRSELLDEGIIDEANKRLLPPYPNSVAILTSSPSSALADVLRTSKELWPLTKLIIVPIPVQGNVAIKIERCLHYLAQKHKELGFEAIVLARGGGSREDLMVFDNKSLCLKLSKFPLPVVTGIGHEDDLTVADLVADYRAATPTAAILALLPSRKAALSQLKERKKRLADHSKWLVRKERKQLSERKSKLKEASPILLIANQRHSLQKKHDFLKALSPTLWLKRGFVILKNQKGICITSIKDVSISEIINAELIDGEIEAKATKILSKKDHLN